MIIRSTRLLLRAATDDDAKAIVSLFDSEHAVSGYGPRWPASLEVTRAAIRDPESINLVVEVQQSILGYLRADLSWGDEVLTVRDFLISADLVGQGYGTEALTATIGFFIERWGGRRVELQVRADNERALSCYRRVGFVVEGRRREVIPREWGPVTSPDYLMLGILADEFRSARNQ